MSQQLVAEDETPGAVVAVLAGKSTGAKCVSCAPSAARSCVHEHSVRYALAMPAKSMRHSRAHMSAYQNIMHDSIGQDGTGLRVHGKSRTRIDMSVQHCAVLCSQLPTLLESDDDSTSSSDGTDVEWFWESCGHDVSDVSVFCPEEQQDYDAIRTCLPELWDMLQSPQWLPEVVEDKLFLGLLRPVFPTHSACPHTRDSRPAR